MVSNWLLLKQKSLNLGVATRTNSSLSKICSAVNFNGTKVHVLYTVRIKFGLIMCMYM